jgi:hypothetical protein
MADYFPPSENLPIFDVSVFRSTNDNVITQEEADRLYLSRLGSASSLATSTAFQGPITTTGNLTLNGAVASSRQIEGSFLKLVDNASLSTNKPLIWYPDPSLQITTNDAVGAVKTIDIKSFNGSGTGVSTSLTCQYGQVQAQGIIKLTQNTDATKASTITQGALNLTVENAVSTGNILLNTTNGAIIANTPIVPSDITPALFSSRPSLGYTLYGSSAATPISSTSPIAYLTAISIPIGIWSFEAAITCVKSTSTFALVSPLSNTRLSYDAASGITWNGVFTSFENTIINDQVNSLFACGCQGGTRTVTITTAQKISLTIQANWTLGGSPTFRVYWSAVRIA